MTAFIVYLFIYVLYYAFCYYALWSTVIRLYDVVILMNIVNVNTVCEAKKFLPTVLRLGKVPKNFQILGEWYI